MTSKKVFVEGHEFDYDAILALMDPKIREELDEDFELMSCNANWTQAEKAQAFVDEYCLRHRTAFGETFDVH